MILRILELTLVGYFYFVTTYFLLVNAVYFILIIRSFREILDSMRHRHLTDERILVRSELTPPISILAPAYNEEATVVQSLNSLLKLNYGKYEVVLVNDGSSDKTLERLIESFDLFPSKRIYRPIIPAKPVRGIYRSRRPEYRNLTIVDKINGGKADALNVGINAAQFDHVCSIDADSLLEADALQKVMKPFLEDESVIAAGGIVRIANGCDVVNGRVVRVGLSKKLLPIFQVVEYFRAFLSGRMAWQGVNGLLIVSGAFGLFHRPTLIDVGGYKPDSIGEDMELIVRLHRRKREQKKRYRIAFVPDPVCWTEAPESVRVLGRQRNRWHRGLLDTLLIHRTMLFRPKYGVIGMAAMPYFLIIELLGPLFEFIGYIVLIALFVMGQLHLDMALLFFICSLFYGVMFSVGAVLLEEISFQRYPKPRDLALLLSVGVLENFGYRQLTVWWRIKAFVDYFKGTTSWGAMERKGFKAVTS